MIYDKKLLILAKGEIERLFETADFELQKRCDKTIDSLEILLERLHHSSCHFPKEE